MAKRRCRYGKLKNPKGRRICRRKPKHGGKARRGSSSSRRCRYGKLKHRIGKRICRKAPSRRGLRHAGKAAQEAAMWKAYKSGSLGRYGRRLRRRR